MRVQPALAAPVTGQWWSLARPYNAKQLADLSDNRFNRAYDNLAYGPLDDAFERMHGTSIRDAWGAPE